MTPFDPWALLTMLVAFYPVVSAAELARARSERPEYFAGGQIIGSKGDKLLLPDGRVFDLIYAAGGLPGDQRWQVLDVTGETSAPGWTLEPGPLTPIDPGVLPPAPFLPVFEPLLGSALAELGDPDGAIGQVHTTIAQSADATAIGNGFDQDLGAAASEVDQQLASIGALDPHDVISATWDQAGSIDGERAAYPNPADEPPDVPPPYVGPIPHDEQTPGEPKPPGPSPL